MLAVVGVLLCVVFPGGPSDGGGPQVPDGVGSRTGASVIAAVGAAVHHPFDVVSVRKPTARPEPAAAPGALGPAADARVDVPRGGPAAPGPAVAAGPVAVVGPVGLGPPAAPESPGAPGPPTIEEVVAPVAVVGTMGDPRREAAATGPVVLAPPVADPVITSLFGYRVNPLGGDIPEFHTGIDYGSPCGAGVLAAGTGNVVEAGWHPYGGGHRIVVDHGGGLQTTYNHLGVLGVPVGTTVQSGTLLGAVGSTGNSTGCHLHFEVLVDGLKVDPLPWLDPSG